MSGLTTPALTGAANTKSAPGCSAKLGIYTYLQYLSTTYDFHNRMLRFFTFCPHILPVWSFQSFYNIIRYKSGNIRNYKPLGAYLALHVRQQSSLALINISVWPRPDPVLCDLILAFKMAPSTDWLPSGRKCSCMHDILHRIDFRILLIIVSNTSIEGLGVKLSNSTCMLFWVNSSLEV